MGLDWRPIDKPKPGFEAEYGELINLLLGKQKQQISFFDRLKGIKPKTIEQLRKRFFEITISPYVTLNAPIVGDDIEATKWAESKFESRIDKSKTFEQFMESMKGFYAVDLVPENDGIPVYIAMHDECHIFRGQFLRDCEDIIGKDLYEEAYISKLSQETVDFGNRLMKVADEYSKKHNCEYLKAQRIIPDFDEDKPETKAHILFSAAKWLIWWGELGHGFEADF
jgi:hypothetical protein